MRVFLVLTFFFYMTAAVPFARADSDLYTVRGVKVDVTDENAVKAREQAFEDAQSIAFSTLARRMLSDSAQAAMEMPAPETIAALVQDFELTGEKMAANRYIGTYTFRFREKAVERFFDMRGQSYTDVASKPILVLPFYQWGARTFLWGDNPWMKAWQTGKFSDSLVPVIAPIGDLEDLRDIEERDALTLDRRAVESLQIRYGAGDVISLLAVPARNVSDGRIFAVDVHMYGMGDGQPAYLNSLRVEIAPRDTEKAVFSRAAGQVRGYLHRDWKRRTVAAPEQDQTLRAIVRIRRMSDWVGIRKDLERVQGLGGVSVVSVNPAQALIDITFRGSQDRLRLALAQEDLALSLPGYADNLPGNERRAVYRLYKKDAENGSGRYR